jgi:hypothetical protein
MKNKTFFAVKESPDENNNGRSSKEKAARTTAPGRTTRSSAIALLDRDYSKTRNAPDRFHDRR